MVAADSASMDLVGWSLRDCPRPVAEAPPNTSYWSGFSIGSRYSDIGDRGNLIEVIDAPDQSARPRFSLH